MAFHRKGRIARPYPGTWDDLFTLVTYDPDTGYIETVKPYPSTGTKTKDGYQHLSLVSSVENASRGERDAGYYRADHIAWMLATGVWPTGWIEHVNGLRMDCALTNLVHCDHDGTRWWLQPVGDDRQLVEVMSEGTLDVDGPVTFRVMEDGVITVRPVVRGEVPEYTLEDDAEEDNSIGEFGVDWGLPDDT